MIDFVLNTNLWWYKIQDLNGATLIGSLPEKELLLNMLNILWMNCYPEPNSHGRDKVIAELELSNCATKIN